MKPTLEEVKKYFENAKVVRGLSTSKKRDLTELKIVREVHFFINCYWVDYIEPSGRGAKNSVLLWKAGKYAEIVEYIEYKKEIMNKELIGKLAKGEIAVVNDGTKEELQEVLKEAFPYDQNITSADYKFYFVDTDEKKEYFLSDNTSLPTVSVKDFFKIQELEGILDRLQKELDALKQSIKEDKELKLPIIEGHAGKDRGKHVDFGCQAFLKSDLKVLGKLGITSFNLMVGGEKVIVSKAQTEQLNTYLKES